MITQSFIRDQLTTNTYTYINKCAKYYQPKWMNPKKRITGIQRTQKYNHINKFNLFHPFCAEYISVTDCQNVTRFCMLFLYNKMQVLSIQSISYQNSLYIRAVQKKGP